MRNYGWVVRRRWQRWQRWSWRARAGWILLGLTGVVACLLLVWLLEAPNNRNSVAVLAEILNLPLAILGLLLVVLDRYRPRAAVSVVDAGRRPYMAPPLDRMVERPDLAGRLVTALTAPVAGEVGLTTGLRGAGGFGKTRLATWVCHRPEIAERFPGGLLWVTVGQEVRGADLAVRINDLTYMVSGRRPAIVDPDAAGAELGRMLDERDPMLLVIDDVWQESQLRPFRFGGHSCTRLVTTRIPDLLPASARCIPVDAMSDEQARRLVSDGVPGLTNELADQLARRTGRWPLLLNLVNGVLSRRVARGQAVQSAAQEIIELLVTQGPAAFDPARPGDRSRAVTATVNASLALLDAADRERYFDLAIFPEDVDIPMEVLTLLWPGRRVDLLGEELTALGLVADYRIDPPGPRLVMHDVMRAYLQTNGGERRVAAHQQLVDAVAGLLPTNDDSVPKRWWLLPADAIYLWRYLPYHLHEAGRDSELADLVCDLRWVEAKTRRFESVVAVEADLQLVDTQESRALQPQLAQAAHLLGPIDPPSALGATLASRLDGVPEIQTAVDRYRGALPHPRLQPAWPLPDKSDPTGHTGHTGPVNYCLFSPDDTLLAAVGVDAMVRLWRVRDQVVHTVLAGHTGPVYSCAFSPDGTLLATTGEDATIRLWHVRDGTLQVALLGHAGTVFDCAFSPDGSLLATTGQDATVRLWRIRDGAPHAVLNGHTGDVNRCAFTPDGNVLATTSDDATVRLWRVRDGAQEAILHGHTGRVVGCAFSPDGQLLATAGADKALRLWRMRDHSQHAMLTGHTRDVTGCAFSPDGTMIATTSVDTTVRLWRVATATQVLALSGHLGMLNYGCAFSHDGTLLSTAGSDGTIRLWRIPGGAEHAVLTGDTDWALACAYSPDGKLLAIAKGGPTVEVWQVDTRTPLMVLTGDRGWMMSCGFSPDGTLLAATGSDATVRLWRIADGKEHRRLNGHTNRVTCCAFSPDGTLLATAGWDRTVRLWRMSDGAEHRRLTGHTGDIWSCAFSPDGTLLATSSFDHTVRLWEIPEGSAHAVMTHAAVLEGCAFSPDGTLIATTSDDSTAQLWQVASGIQQQILKGHNSGLLYKCAFSPDGTLLATAGSDRTVRLWHVATGRCHCAIRLAVPAEGIAWHPDGKRICTVGGAGIYMFDYEA